jgi:hypothetical protein
MLRRCASLIRDLLVVIGRLTHSAITGDNVHDKRNGDAIMSEAGLLLMIKAPTTTLATGANHIDDRIVKKFYLKPWKNP